MKQQTKVAENNVVNITKSTVRKSNNKAVQLNDDFELVMHKAEQLHKQYKQFDEQYIQRTNDALYALLAEMQKVCLHVQSLATREAVVAKLRKRLKSEYDIKTQKNSTEVGIIVRYTLRNARKTAHLYARVLQTAIDAGIKAEDLADYIRERGGVENIRKATVDEATRDAQKKYFDAKDYGTHWLFRERAANKALGTVQWNGGTDIQHRLIADGQFGDFTVLIALKNRETGETKIVGTLFETKQIEDVVLTNYCNCIELAATERSGYGLYNAFKKAGIAAETFWRWAEHNGFGVHEETLTVVKNMAAAARERQQRKDKEIAEYAEKEATVSNVA